MLLKHTFKKIFNTSMKTTKNIPIRRLKHTKTTPKQHPQNTTHRNHSFDRLSPKTELCLLEGLSRRTELPAVQQAACGVTDSSGQKEAATWFSLGFMMSFCVIPKKMVIFWFYFLGGFMMGLKVFGVCSSYLAAFGFYDS